MRADIVVKYSIYTWIEMIKKLLNVGKDAKKLLLDAHHPGFKEFLYVFKSGQIITNTCIKSFDIWTTSTYFSFIKI